MGRDRKDRIKQKEQDKKIQIEKLRNGGRAKGKQDHETGDEDVKSIALQSPSASASPADVPGTGDPHEAAASDNDQVTEIPTVIEDRMDDDMNNNTIEHLQTLIQNTQNTPTESDDPPEYIPQETPVTVAECFDTNSELINSEEELINYRKKSKDELNQIISQLTQQLKEVTTYSTKQELQLFQLKKTLEIQFARYEELRVQKAKLEENLLVKESEISCLAVQSTHYEEVRAQNAKLEETLREKESELSQAQDDLNQQDEQCQELETEIDLLKEEKRKLEKDLAEKKERISSDRVLPCRCIKAWNMKTYLVKDDDWEFRYTKVFEDISLFRLLEHSSTRKTEASAERIMQIAIEEPWLIHEWQVENLQTLIYTLHASKGSKVQKEREITVRTCQQKDPWHDSIKYLVGAKLDSENDKFHDRCIRFKDGVKLHLPRGIHLWDEKKNFLPVHLFLTQEGL